MSFGVLSSLFEVKDKKTCIQTSGLSSESLKDVDCVNFQVLCDSHLPSCCFDFVSALKSGCDNIIKYGEACNGRGEYFKGFAYIHRPPLYITGLKAPESLSLGNSFLISDYSIENIDLLPNSKQITFQEACSPQNSNATLLTIQLSAQLTTLLCLISKGVVYRWETDHFNLINTNRLRSQRYSLIDRFRSCTAVGVLVTNPSPEAAKLSSLMAQMIRANSKAAYLVYAGKINGPKLGNFTGIKSWICIGCTSTAFSNFDDQCIITPFEALCAFELCDFWNDTYETDFSVLTELLSKSPQKENQCQELDTFQYETTLSIVSGMQGVAVSEETQSESTEEYSEGSSRIMPGISGLPRKYNVIY